MGCYLSKKRIAELHAGRGEVRRQFADVRKRFVLRTYKTHRGAEFAKHGFCRRLETLARVIDQVYELLAPGQEDIPPRGNVVDATTAIQAFTTNAFGCLDNIAWIWVYEKDVKGKHGVELDPKSVGLGKKAVREKLTQQFRDFLDKRQDWFANLINFRDSLAHRIPLYIPPYTVPEANVEKYRQFDKQKWEEPAKSDPNEYAKLKAQQLTLCRFVPGMIHSIFEQAPQVEFHTQL